MSDPGQTRQYSVPAVEKTIAIFDALTASPKGLTISELTLRLSLPKATIFMILNVLERSHLVRKDTHGRFLTGPRLYQWGADYIAKLDVVDVARPFLTSLADDTGLTSHLGIVHEQSMMFIDRVEALTFVRFSTSPGTRQDVHVSSIGKAIAAHLELDALDALLGAGPLAAYTPRSITSVDAFREELERVRAVGYAVDDEEGEIGVRCVGAAVFNHHGEVCAGVSVTGIVSQVSNDDMPRLGEKLTKVAGDISRQLGCPELTPPLALSSS